MALAGIFSLNAAPVAIDDASFEGNFLEVGGWSNSLGPEWQEANGPDSSSGFEEYVEGFSVNGTDSLGMAQGHTVWQDLAVSYQANKRYTLTVGIGNRENLTSGSNSSIFRFGDSSGSIYASSSTNASTLPLNSFDDFVLVFETPSEPAAIGEPIRIILEAGGEGRSHFDNIRLEEEDFSTGLALVEAVPATLISTTGATLNGEVTDIGAGEPSVTFFYGRNDGGTDPSSWESSLDLVGTFAGTFSAPVSGIDPGTSYFFAVRATNPEGVSWSSNESFETLAAAPTVANGPVENLLASRATLGAEVVDSGGDNPSVILYYGPSDGGTTEANWDASVSLGTLSESESTTVSGLTSGLTYFFRVRGENSGGVSWASASSSFTTLSATLPSVVNRSPSGVTANTASLRGEVIDSGSDGATVTLYYGSSDGGTTPGNWAMSIDVGPEDGNFSRFVTGLSPETFYYYRSSASNGAGTSWAPASEIFSTPAALPDQVVINEIHYDSRDETSAEEFIELHNPGSNDLSLGGWSLSEGVAYSFPPGTILPAGGYLLISEDPASLQDVYGVTALGPWEGGLRNEGEEILLLDAGGNVQDRVDYGSGFPWPTAARGGGSSAELVNPEFDNDLGGSWRSSGDTISTPQEITFVPEADFGWSYFKGTQEASNPVTDWRLSNFIEDANWLTGQTPLGYGDGDDLTVLEDMRFNYSSVYLRNTFTIDPTLLLPETLLLRLYVDDGAVVWINGTEVARFSVPSGQLDFDDLGNNHEAAWVEFELTGADRYLLGGTNTLAIHALNGTLRSSDFSIDASLSTRDTEVSARPTPGRANSVLSSVLPPQIRQVEHSPKEPTSSDTVIITAKITDPDGIGPVALEYQLVEAGSYIRLTDSAYETSWTTVPMVDDGTGDDAVGGDFIFTAVLPAALHNHRQLVRYRIIAEDGAGESVQVPYEDDEQPNFAYFVYDGVPSWTGSFTSASANETFSGSLLSSLPVYHVIADGTDVNNSQYNPDFDGVNQRGTMVYDGEVYDHIEFENRGEASTYVAGKNKWRIHFNRSRRFEGRDDWGRKRPSTVNRLNFNTCASPWAAVNRGMAGLDESVSFRLYELAGVPSPRTNYFTLRVIDDAEESPADQYAGDLWGLYITVEQPSGKFLDDRDLPDGNVYKIERGNGDKKEQGDTQVTDSSDWNAFYAASNNTNTEQWWRDNMHLPTYYSMRSLNRLLGNVDIRLGFNHYFYREPTNDRWWPIPWDLDMMYIAETHQAGFIRQQNALNIPALRVEFANRARELLDLTASDDSMTGGQIGQLIDEYAQIVNPTGQVQTWADVDANMWNEHPRTSSNFSPQTNHRGNFFRTPYEDSRFGGNYVRTLNSADHEGFVDHITDYTTAKFTGNSWQPGNGIPAGYGYEYLRFEATDASIPNTPSITYTGEAGYPVNTLSFESSSFSDPDGDDSFGKMRWRAAQIAAPGLAGYISGEPRVYEIETTYLSDDIGTFQSGFQFPESALIPGNTYRVRVQHEDDTGRTSHWSAPLEFVVNPPDIDVFTNNLMVTEIMYNPPEPTGDEQLASTDNDAFEFIELTNISPDLILDLSQLAFTDGIEFDFADADITTLPPGQCLVLVKNREAFEARYGTGLAIAGVYPNSLSNGGEQLTLSYALNSPVRLFTYDDKAPWPDADGSGFSLVLADPTSAPPHGMASSWTLSETIGGNPCQLDSSPTGQSFEDYLAAFFSPEELANNSITGQNADPDGDGLSNLLEYSQGSAPNSPDDLAAFICAGLETIEGESYLTLSYREREGGSSLAYFPEVSTELTAWQTAPGGVVEVSRSDAEEGLSNILVRSAVPVSENPKLFIRLRVELLTES